MTTAQLLIGNIHRITSQNDWVLACVILAILALFVVLNSFNREATVADFFTQKQGDSPNDLATWASVSVIFWVLVCVLFSQFVPVVPSFVRFSALPFQLNKFGYTLFATGIVIKGKSALTYLFYQSCGDGENLKNNRFYFSRFYFALSVLLIIAIFVNYFLGISTVFLLKLWLICATAIGLVRIAFLIINGSHILPTKWFYKILYICTLQIVPLLVVYRMLFF